MAPPGTRAPPPLLLIHVACDAFPEFRASEGLGELDELVRGAACGWCSHVQPTAADGMFRLTQSILGGTLRVAGQVRSEFGQRFGGARIEVLEYVAGDDEDGQLALGETAARIAFTISELLQVRGDAAAPSVDEIKPASALLLHVSGKRALPWCGELLRELKGFAGSLYESCCTCLVFTPAAPNNEVIEPPSAPSVPQTSNAAVRQSYENDGDWDAASPLRLSAVAQRMDGKSRCDGIACVAELFAAAASAASSLSHPTSGRAHDESKADAAKPPPLAGGGVAAHDLLGELAYKCGLSPKYGD